MATSKKNTKATEKTAEQAEVKESPKAETKKKWGAGRYRVLATYIGSMGAFFKGGEYDLTAEQAEAFGKAGEIVEC